MGSKMKAIVLAPLFLAVNAKANGNNFEMTGKMCGAVNQFYWIYQNNTADGYGYYKDVATGFYLHHDVDCNGPENDAYDSTGESARWIVSGVKPNTTRTTDLDNSTDCAAILVIVSTSNIPESGEWAGGCYTPAGALVNFERSTFTVRDIGQQTAPPPPPPPSPTTSNFKMSGYLCEAVEYYWIYQGNTADGYGYYKDVATGRYLHHDQDCNGPENDYASTGATPMWIINDIRPSTTRTSDLDNSGDCDNVFTSILATSNVPESGEWFGTCFFTQGGRTVTQATSATLTVRDIGEQTAPAGWRGAGVQSSASSAIPSVALAFAFLASAMLLA